MMKKSIVRCACAAVAVSALCAAAEARTLVGPQDTGPRLMLASVSTAVPPDYVIGAEDVLSIVFWGETALSTEVVVRPDGKISVPLLKDVRAAGYTPEQLADVLIAAAAKYVSQPAATVIVKEIHSRKVFVLGQVGKPGAYALIGDMTVLQVLATAGDVLEYAKSKDIVVVRKENGVERRFRFNYKEVVRGKRVEQDILLKPGDTVIVP